MKDPVPIRWACGQCGAEMRLLGPDLICCVAYFCKTKNVPFRIEHKHPDQWAMEIQAMAA